MTLYFFCVMLCNSMSMRHYIDIGSPFVSFEVYCSGKDPITMVIMIIWDLFHCSIPHSSTASTLSCFERV